MFPLALAVLIAAQVHDDNVGFGGVPADSRDETGHELALESVDEGEAAPAARPHDFKTGAGSKTLKAFPEPVAVDLGPTKTPLELELERARLDPAQHPLLALRVEVARARQAFEQGRKNGLYSLRDEEANLRESEAVLVDVERIALHRMNVCMTRQGKRVVVLYILAE